MPAFPDWTGESRRYEAGAIGEDAFLSPFVAAERGYIDEVIMPHATRKRLSRVLAMLANKEAREPVEEAR